MNILKMKYPKPLIRLNPLLEIYSYDFENKKFYRLCFKNNNLCKHYKMSIKFWDNIWKYFIWIWIILNMWKLIIILMLIITILLVLKQTKYIKRISKKMVYWFYNMLSNKIKGIYRKPYFKGVLLNSIGDNK